jgi:hypothetical protein
MTMTELSSRVDGFKNSNPIPELITCGVDGLKTQIQYRINYLWG